MPAYQLRFGAATVEQNFPSDQAALERAKHLATTQVAAAASESGVELWRLEPPGVVRLARVTCTQAVH